MKLIAHYDSEGTIHALLRVDAPEGMSVMLAPEAGLFAGEIDPAGLELQSDAPGADQLEALTKTYKIATPLPRLKLTRKSG